MGSEKEDIEGKMESAQSVGSEAIIELTQKYGAKNYHPLPVVISKAKGVWVEDVDGKKYMDMLSAYSAVSHGHCHPKVIKALKEQADRVTLTSRAFMNDKLGTFYEKVSEITGKEKVLPMNSGTEAVETAIKAARRWGHQVKGVPEDKGEIIACTNNFHGRSITIISFSTTEEYREGFGPFTPGFKVIPFGDIAALEKAIGPNTVAFLVEPMQGEGGIVLPPTGYLKEARELCSEKDVLFIADEIQTGLGRTGKMFACDWEEVVPDIYILGKALSAGVYPVSAVAADEEVMKVFNPGSHGSTFGGNPLGVAAATKALEVIQDEDFVKNSLEMGRYFRKGLNEIDNPVIKDVRGRGLFIGVELTETARPYAERLQDEGVLVKDTRGTILRFAPPLVITKEEVDWALERVRKVLS